MGFAVFDSVVDLVFSMMELRNGSVIRRISRTVSAISGILSARARWTMGGAMSDVSKIFCGSPQFVT